MKTKVSIAPPATDAKGLKDSSRPAVESFGHTSWMNITNVTVGEVNLSTGKF